MANSPPPPPYPSLAPSTLILLTAINLIWWYLTYVKCQISYYYLSRVISPPPPSSYSPPPPSYEEVDSYVNLHIGHIWYLTGMSIFDIWQIRQMSNMLHNSPCYYHHLTPPTPPPPPLKINSPNTEINNENKINRKQQ